VNARRGSRPGLALPAALVLSVVLGAVAAGALQHAAGAAREARLAGAVARAEAAADAALVVTLQAWDGRWNVTMAPGAWRARTVPTAAGAASVHVARLDARHWLLAARGEQAAGLVGGRVARRVALLARTPHLRLDAGAALVSGGAVALAAGAALHGGDAAPAGWGDCVDATGDDGAGDAARVAPGLAPTGEGTIVGAVREDPDALRDETYALFGEADWAALAERADVRVEAGGALAPLPATDAEGACAEDAWGEPWRGVGAVDACVGAASGGPRARRGAHHVARAGTVAGRAARRRRPRRRGARRGRGARRRARTAGRRRRRARAARRAARPRRRHARRGLARGALPLRARPRGARCRETGRARTTRLAGRHAMTHAACGRFERAPRRAVAWRTSPGRVAGPIRYLAPRRLVFTAERRAAGVPHATARHMPQAAAPRRIPPCRRGVCSTPALLSACASSSAAARSPSASTSARAW
jgi:hypothetical protein